MVIERAQFAHNPKIYERGAFKDEMGFDGSWLEWFLLETERTCGESRLSTGDADEQPRRGATLGESRRDAAAFTTLPTSSTSL